MNRLVLTCLILLAIGQLCIAQSFWVESQNKYGLKTGFSPLLSNWNFKQYQSGFGVWNFNLVSPTWSEALVGPMYGSKIGGLYLEGGVGGGFETNKKPLRGGAYLFGDHDKYWFLVDAEYGGSGHWYLGFLERKFKNGFRLGLHAQEFAPHGLRIGYKFSKIPIYLYTVSGYDPQNTDASFIFSIRYTP